MDETRLIGMLLRLTEEVTELRREKTASEPDYVRIHDPRTALLVMQAEELIRERHRVEFQLEVGKKAQEMKHARA
jgi:hypothetical protein